MRRQAAPWSSIPTSHALRPSRHHAGSGSPLREAIASAERALAIGPGDAETQIASGYVHLFAGNHAEAARAVETALRLDPNLAPIDREIAGLVFLLKGNIEKAIETLERTRDDAPDRRCFAFRLPQPTLAPVVFRTRKPLWPTAFISRRRPNPSLDGAPCCLADHLSAHLRKPEDLALIVDVLREAGLPEWPFGFIADENDRLTGAEITALVMGHTLKGQLEPGDKPAIMHLGQDGTAGFRTMTRMLTERVFVDRDLLCEQSENLFGCPCLRPGLKAQRRFRTKAIPTPIQVRCFTSL